LSSALSHSSVTGLDEQILIENCRCPGQDSNHTAPEYNLSHLSRCHDGFHVEELTILQGRLYRWSSWAIGQRAELKRMSNRLEHCGKDKLILYLLY
jgi:hypothetical protein